MAPVKELVKNSATEMGLAKQELECKVLSSENYEMRLKENRQKYIYLENK